ncbi:hypothetical protein AMC78_CH02593 [Rhizobium phaseoli]|nr:hypothetical protein AMC78_CH02593 [Rhizobium phaseoli]
MTIARYGIFGLACLLLMIDRRFRPVGMAPSRLLTGLLLGGAGYVGYFVSAAFAVQLAGAAIPACLPLGNGLGRSGNRQSRHDRRGRPFLHGINHTRHPRQLRGAGDLDHLRAGQRDPDGVGRRVADLFPTSRSI